MDAVVPPPTSGGSRTTTSSYDVRITDKINMHPKNPPPTSVYFPTQTANQEKPPSLSIVATLQFSQDVTHIK